MAIAVFTTSAFQPARRAVLASSLAASGSAPQSATSPTRIHERPERGSVSSLVGPPPSSSAADAMYAPEPVGIGTTATSLRQLLEISLGRRYRATLTGWSSPL